MDYHHLTWCCPYYEWNLRTSVSCEGGKIALPDSKTARDYFRTYCADVAGWRRCTVARSITRFYEKKEDE